ncbi:MAG: electron transfer flavoprotein subunit beta/FixA family protein [Chloroflexales bacterium]|nr:electron transfer flavoprotein subunit beta/FixA family protein [Chloroflexales bacterium]
MNIVVCLKQVPRDNTVAITANHGIDASGIEPIINLFDEYALEAALQLNDSHGGTVTVLSLGDIEWQDQMRRAMAMGATDALLVQTDAQYDVFAAAQIIANATRHLGLPDLVMCGRNATDDESAALAPMLARILGWPHVTYVAAIPASDETSLTAVRQLEDEREMVQVSLPAVVSVAKGEQEPRFPSLLRVRKFAKQEIPTLTVADVGTPAPSSVQIIDRVPPPARKGGEIISGADVVAKVAALVDRLIADQAL